MTSDWIVAGWYTADYRDWWLQLRSQLIAIGAPHDFVLRAKQDPSWEANTMRKPAEILAAIDRHPGKTIIFLDVDCAIPGGYGGLAELAQIGGDVGFYVRITALDVKYCAVPADRCERPVILHDSASRHMPKAGRLQRWINRLAGPPVPAAA